MSIELAGRGGVTLSRLSEVEGISLSNHGSSEKSNSTVSAVSSQAFALLNSSCVNSGEAPVCA